MRIWHIAWMLFACCCLSATEHFDWTPVKVTTAENGLRHWQRSEAYRDHHPLFGREKILDVAKFKNPQILQAFPKDLYKADSTDASLMVLFYGKNWDKAKKTPILLVHGAGDDASRAWIHPYDKMTPDTIPPARIGFAQRLIAAGFPVFAINFSHGHGCNYRQAEQIHNAIAVIKSKTKSSKVHIIAHSKGNCAASIYLCGSAVNRQYSTFLSPPRDVDTYIQLAAANKGIDLVFRYYLGNITTIANDLASPLCFHQALVYGTWQNFYKRDIYDENPGPHEGNYFPGQNQLLYNLVSDGLDFSLFSYTPVDFNFTMKACYYGGTTAFVSSYGIEHAIAEGESTIAGINRCGLEPSVKLVNIYGTNPILDEIEWGFLKIPVGVSDHPSDGLLYVHSTSYTKGLTSRGALLLGKKQFAKNHLQIARDREVVEWIVSTLGNG